MSMLLVNLQLAVLMRPLPSYPLYIRLNDPASCPSTSIAPTPTQRTIAPRPPHPIFNFPPMLPLTRENISTHSTAAATDQPAPSAHCQRWWNIPTTPNPTYPGRFLLTTSFGQSCAPNTSTKHTAVDDKKCVANTSRFRGTALSSLIRPRIEYRHMGTV